VAQKVRGAVSYFPSDGRGLRWARAAFVASVAASTLSLRAPTVRRGRRGASALAPSRVLLAASVALAAVVLAASGCGGRSTAARLHHDVLSVSDLPAGWSAVPTSGSKAPTLTTSASCLSSASAITKSWQHEVASFVQGSSIPTLVEVLAAGPDADRTWQRLAAAMARCRSATFDFAGTKVRSSVRPISFPAVGGSSSATAWSFTLGGVRIGFDLVLFHSGGIGGYVAYSDLGSPRTATVKAFAQAAVSKVEKGGSTPPVPDAVSVTSTPVQTADTKLGPVGYRSVGSGPPLVLVTGYSGTMEGWDRRLVDALAAHHRVVLLDNAGIGETAPLEKLTIDRMANQTSALIDALGLKRADVLGWSMGSMIAQAVAVLHPSQVRRLVLCASFPGNGTTVRPAESAIDALKSGNGAKIMTDLFPADQTPAQNTYLAALSSWPPAPAVPAGVLTAQSHAVDLWWAGTDPAGKKTARIAAPTLVADGAEDALDPAANSRAVAKLIPGAQLVLYPDAGHAFLFQKPAFLARLESFLG
jgi:pimeloyl-ACP methyl ester carboxylesterase